MALSRRRIGSPRCSGFTLVEALVAVGLTSILLWGLLQLFTSATRFTSVVTLEAELCSAGRAVLERMTRELSSATVRDGKTISITNSGDFDIINFWAPLGQDGTELVKIDYRTSSGALLREEGSSGHKPFGLNVERFNITYIKADGSAGSAYGTLTELPLAICLEIRMSDRKGKATIALCSSAFLPGSGL